MAYKIVMFYKFNHYNSLTESLGDVDIRPNYYDSINEKEVAEQSLSSYGISDYKNIVRFIAIIEDSTFVEALNKSKILFEDTFDLLMRYPMARISKCEESGYYCDLSSLSIRPFLKPEEVQDFLGTMFHINNGTYWHITPQQFIASGRDDELVKAYFRSINWYHKGQNQNRLYLRFLFTWISLETITKTSENDDIVSKLCLALGFPLKKTSKKRSIPFFIELSERVNNYHYWRDFIYKTFDGCRTLRNKIVHSGFKEADVDLTEMQVKMYLLNYVYQSVISYIESIILSAETSLNTAWDLIPQQIVNNKNLINSLNGTLIYTLENKEHIPRIFNE